MFVRNKLKIFASMTAILAAGMACNLPFFDRQAPDEAEPIPVTTAAVEELEQNIATAAVQATQTGSAEIIFTEEQLTSLVALEVASGSDPALENPQVYLRDGQIQLTGDYTQSGIKAPLSLAGTIQPTSDGLLQTEVVSGKVGPLPLPEEILSQIEQQINQILNNQVNLGGNNLFIEEVSIGGGQMIIRGNTR